MKLSEHFSLAEFTRSATAISHGWKNEPSTAEIEWMRYLCVSVLEPLRAELGRPITISSGFRCPKLNKAVGGVEQSQHMYGQAADLRVLSKDDGAKIMKILRRNPLVSKALYERSRSTGSRWIHVAVASVPVRYFDNDYPAV